MEEGEWKVRQHGKSKNRQWIKLNLASQPDNLEIVSQLITFNDVDDAETGIEISAKLKTISNPVLVMEHMIR